MKFTKYNNPSKKKKRRIEQHGSSYMAQMEGQLYQLLAQAETDEERTNLIKAYNVTIRK